MDDATLDFIEAEFTALGFLLEVLMANNALSHGAGPDELMQLEHELLRQFRSLPATTSDGRPAAANDHDKREQAAARIAQRLRHVRARVEQARDL